MARLVEFRYLSIGTSEVDVRRYGEAAIVCCVQRRRASWRGGPMALAVRLSQVRVREPAGWRIVAIQFSALGPRWPPHCVARAFLTVTQRSMRRYHGDSVSAITRGVAPVSAVRMPAHRLSGSAHAGSLTVTQ